MTRKDRLHALITYLGDGALHRASDLAATFGVTERTIYRDMALIAASGVAVQGTQGQGYRVAPGITLPPLTLSDAELEALMLALTAVGTSALEQADAAQSLAAKIEALLPEDGSRPEQPPLGTHGFVDNPRGHAHRPAVRDAIQARQRLRVTLLDAEHTIRPLYLEYAGRAWRCVAWSETQDGFLVFALDQLAQLTPLPGLFVDEPGKKYTDWKRQSGRIGG